MLVYLYMQHILLPGSMASNTKWYRCVKEGKSLKAPADVPRYWPILESPYTIKAIEYSSRM